MEKQKNQKPDSVISYHNKDIVSKLFGEKLKHKSFEVYGLRIPEITEVLPTNLPAVEANAGGRIIAIRIRCRKD